MDFRRSAPVPTIAGLRRFHLHRGSPRYRLDVPVLKTGPRQVTRLRGLRACRGRSGALRAVQGSPGALRGGGECGVLVPA